MNRKGTEYLQKPMEYNFTRAETDNDMCMKTAWKNAGYHHMQKKVHTATVTQVNGSHCHTYIPIGGLVIALQEGCDGYFSWPVRRTGQIINKAVFGIR